MTSESTAQELGSRFGDGGVIVLSYFYPWLRKWVLKHNLMAVATLAVLSLGLPACGAGPTPGGDIALGGLMLVNDAYGCSQAEQ